MNLTRGAFLKTILHTGIASAVSKIIPAAPTAASAASEYGLSISKGAMPGNGLMLLDILQHREGMLKAATQTDEVLQSAAPQHSAAHKKADLEMRVVRDNIPGSPCERLKITCLGGNCHMERKERLQNYADSLNKIDPECNIAFDGTRIMLRNPSAKLLDELKQHLAEPQRCR